MVAIGIKFKHPNLESEFWDDQRTDPLVRSHALTLGIVAYNNGFYITITQIGRDPEEEKKFYGVIKSSGHLERPARAIDFRSWDLKDEELNVLLNYHKTYLDLGDWWTLMVHTVTTGPHLHLQTPHRDINKLIT
jgi:hypothetical protein